MRTLVILASICGLVGCSDPCKESGTMCSMVGDGSSGYNGEGLKAKDTRLYYPMDVMVEPATDEVYFVDWNNEMIRHIAPDGTVDRAVGRDLPGDGAPDQADRTDPGSPGNNTSLNHPVQAEFGPDGRMYIAAWHNHKIRRWDPVEDRVRVIVANTEPDDGNGANAGFEGDGGPAEDALIWFPSSIAFLADGSFVFTDEKNRRVRHVDLDDNIETIAGTGEWSLTDGPCATATFRFPDSPDTPQPRPGGALETDLNGMIYVADTYNHVIRRIDRVADRVDVIAGTGVAGFGGDGGDALDAQLNAPTDLEFGPDGRLYIADSSNHAIRALDLESGTIETVVGTGVAGDSEDGGLASEATLNTPYGLDFTADGAMWIADTFNSRIRRVTP